MGLYQRLDGVTKFVIDKVIETDAKGFFEHAKEEFMDGVCEALPKAYRKVVKEVETGLKDVKTEAEEAAKSAEAKVEAVVADVKSGAVKVIAEAKAEADELVAEIESRTGKNKGGKKDKKAEQAPADEQKA